MKQYKHILFDLDHTLWDYEKNSTEVLHDLYASFQLGVLGNFTAEEFCAAFHKVNYALWRKHQLGDYGQQQLRSDRFRMIFTELGVAEAEMPLVIAGEFLRLCPLKPHVFPYTHEVLEYLKDHYYLHIITNGFSDVQWVKLNSAGLTDYFTEVITSDDAGYRKPNPEIFRYSLARIGTTAEECIMVGDNLETDIQGAAAAGIHSIFFNPLKLTHQALVQHEICCLSELKGIL